MSDASKQQLTPEQYHVMRQQGTEPPFSGKLLHNQATGQYTCAACGAELFSSQAKYETSTPGLSGWPSFAQVISSTAVNVKDDYSWGMHRLEVSCARCGSHLGHLFDDAQSPTGQHYCINSVALDFRPK